MKFQLVGSIHWSVGSCHDGRKREINEEFDGPDIDHAIVMAREIIKKLHHSHAHLSEYTLDAELRLVTPVWNIKFHDEEPARPAVLAQPARPATPAHLEERKVVC